MSTTRSKITVPIYQLIKYNNNNTVSVREEYDPHGGGRTGRIVRGHPDLLSRLHSRGIVQ